MPGSLRAALDAAVSVLQDEWYGADPYAARTGLYHWSDPALPRHAPAVGGLMASLQDMRCWWNSANAITSLIDYMLVTGNRVYLAAVEHTFAAAQTAYTLKPQVTCAAAAAGASAGVAAAALCGFLPARPASRFAGAALSTVTGAACGAVIAAGSFGRNHLRNFIDATPGGFYDDESWWALAWLRAYDLTHDVKFLDMATTIFWDMTTGWDSACGGGMYWRRNGADRQGRSPYKNAITNELFLALAAGLSVRTQATASSPRPSPSFSWALREWQWFAASGMINDRSLVHDGLTIPASRGSPCAADDSTAIWSYNQGVILGALCDMHQVTCEPGYLTTASQIADAVLGNRLTAGTRRPEAGIDHEGILTEHDGGAGDVGGCQFKGIFVRNLARLYALTGAQRYREFLDRNACSAIAHADPAGHYGMRWNAEPDMADFIRQTSAVDLLNAALSTRGGAAASKPAASAEGTRIR